MNHLHMEKVFHRDLTSRNILLTANMDAKVADFGLSKKTVENSSGSFTMGSLAWMAPEVLSNPKEFTDKSDVYSYGVILWELFTHGKNPCPSALTHVALANKVINEGWRPSLPHRCPQQWTSFIEVCWHQKPTKRLAFKNIVVKLQGWADNPPPIRTDTSGDSSDLEESQYSDYEESINEEEDNPSQMLSHSQSEYDDNII